MKLKPLEDRIVIRPLEADKKSAGGIIIPDNAKEKPQKGKILAVGPGKKSEQGKVIPISVKVGDNVLYGKYSGTEIRVNGEDLLITREDEILAIL